MFFTKSARMARTLQTRPYAVADIHGADGIHGTAAVYPAPGGVLVAVEVNGLPDNGFHGLHLHSGAHCTGTADDPFHDTGGHYNPANAEHPRHAGDFPPLLSDNGYAYTVFYTPRLTALEMVGKTVVVHRQPDDFHTQPSGNSGEKLACGQVLRR